MMGWGSGELVGGDGVEVGQWGEVGGSGEW